MGFMSYLGICILAWLVVGFIVGIKVIYVDKAFSNEKMRELRKIVKDNNLNIGITEAQMEQAFELLKNKKVILTMFSLMGVVAFIYDTIGTFKKNKK